MDVQTIRNPVEWVMDELRGVARGVEDAGRSIEHTSTHLFSRPLAVSKIEISDLFYGEGSNSVSLPDPSHLREGHAAFRTLPNLSTLEKAGLGLSDRKIPTIVQDEELDGELVTNHGLEFLNVHLQ